MVSSFLAYSSNAASQIEGVRCPRAVFLFIRRP
jgi:hypothetical protein